MESKIGELYFVCAANTLGYYPSRRRMRHLIAGTAAGGARPRRKIEPERHGHRRPHSTQSRSGALGMSAGDGEIDKPTCADALVESGPIRGYSPRVGFGNVRVARIATAQLPPRRSVDLTRRRAPELRPDPDRLADQRLRRGADGDAGLLAAAAPYSTRTRIGPERRPDRKLPRLRRWSAAPAGARRRLAAMAPRYGERCRPRRWCHPARGCWRPIER